MTGAEVAVRAREIRPDLRVLFITGYARNAIIHHGRLDKGVELITKPFTYADLAAKVRDVIDRQAWPPRISADDLSKTARFPVERAVSARLGVSRTSRADRNSSWAGRIRIAPEVIFLTGR
jgi:DNA-binding response OmpR family regulator